MQGIALKLYDYFRSSAAYRVRIAINLKQMEVEREFVSLRDGVQLSDGYKTVNPQGLVPTFVDDAGRHLSQSLAIIEYFDTIQPEPPLFPADGFDRALVNQFCQIIACDIHPVNNLRILKHLKSEFNLMDADVSDRWYGPWVTKGFDALEPMVAQYSAAGQYCFGDQASAADCCLVPQIFNAQRFDVTLDNYPNLLKVYEFCNQIEAFSEAQPSRQPDAS